MNGSSNDSESRARLAQSYSMRTGEDSQLANGPIKHRIVYFGSRIFGINTQ